MTHRHVTAKILGLLLLFGLTGTALSQTQDARDILLSSAEAMGGLERLQSLDNLVMTGFGQYMNQQGGSNPSPDPNAPPKMQGANSIERIFDLHNRRALLSDRRGFLFPFAIEAGHAWNRNQQLQNYAASLDHPLPALLAALATDSRLGPVTAEGNDLVVAFSISSGENFWLGIDQHSRLPSWLRWISPHNNLGEVTNTTWFTGYLPFDGIRLPVGITNRIDWRDLMIAFFHIDGYRFNTDTPDFPAAPSSTAAAAAEATATAVAEGVWDVRVGNNGGAVLEFEDHLLMFEAYGSEAATLARIDLANSLVPGKEVRKLISSHHHFDHSGGIRAAVSRGISIIARSGNEQIYREMTSRPAPNYPDALARNPLPLDFIAVDEHLLLEDDSMRVDVYHAIGHAHMAEAVFAYIPEHRIFLEGDFTTHNWTWHWWGGAYLDSVEHYGLDPVLNIPVHGVITSFEETIDAIEEQVARARAFCAQNEDAGIFMAGCPVQYSR